jgi:hypothetical protein
VSATGVALGGFTEEDETLFRSMATNICTVIQRAELDVEVRARRKQTQALLQLSEISSTEFGVKKAMQRILRAASTAVDAGAESDTSALMGISQREMNATINRSFSKTRGKTRDTFSFWCCVKARIMNIVSLNLS